MTPGSILICRDAHAPHWQLGPLPPDYGRLTLVAWTPGASDDGGVPADVRAVLARSWTSIARVTFPSSVPALEATDAWSSSDVGMIRTLSARGIVDRTLARLRGAPANATLISTRDPDIASRIFEDAGFPWWLQGQVVLLSNPDADPPAVDEPTLLALFENDWTRRGAALGSIGVEGVVRPGVDGDVAGILTLTDTFDARLLESLERDARGAGLTWAPVSETALLETPLGG